MFWSSEQEQELTVTLLQALARLIRRTCQLLEDAVPNAMTQDEQRRFARRLLVMPALLMETETPVSAAVTCAIAVLLLLFHGCPALQARLGEPAC